MNQHIEARAFHEIEKEYGLKAAKLDVETKEELLNLYLNMRFFEKTFKEQVNALNRMQKKEASEDTFEKTFNETVSKVLIPLIDPHFTKRTKKDQDTVREIVEEFYVLCFLMPNLDVREAVTRTIELINKELKK